MKNCSLPNRIWISQRVNRKFYSRIKLDIHRTVNIVQSFSFVTRVDVETLRLLGTQGDERAFLTWLSRTVVNSVRYNRKTVWSLVKSEIPMQFAGAKTKEAITR